MDKKMLATFVAIFLLLVGVGYATSIGRFSPTHKIVEPVYCGACHTDQIAELNATTHLPHFAGAIYEEAESIEAGGAATVTQAEAISGGCMMCHNTWNNRDKIYVNGYSLTTAETVAGTQTKLSYNDVGFNPDPVKGKAGTMYDVPILLNGTGMQVIRLGTSVTGVKVVVQDPGTSGVTAGRTITNTSTTSSVILDGSADANLMLLNGTGSVKITYTVNGAVVSFKTMWGELSALSPQQGVFYEDSAAAITGTASCGNVEKGMCHAVEIAVGKNTKNMMQENNLGTGGASSGSGTGVFFQHEMGYTSADYQAKQVKLCGVCHVNKLPPMDANGEPLGLMIDGVKVIRSSHGTEILNTTISVTSSDWAHKKVSCISCHAHAGIKSGVTSN